MRAQHTPHLIPAFPVYSSSWLSDTQLVLGGGGGTSRSGIKNKLRLYSVGQDRNLDLLDEHELEKGEDAPMSMAASSTVSSLACGVNSTEDLLEKGHNENCRVFRIKENKLSLLGTQGTLPTEDKEDYQKVTSLSPDAQLLAVAGTNTFQILSFPSLNEVSPRVHTTSEIYDIAFSEKNIVVATTTALLVYTLPSIDVEKASPPKKKKQGKQRAKLPSELELERTVQVPSSVTGTFRSAKFHPTIDNIIYTAVNTNPVRSKKSKLASRMAYVLKWDTATWTVTKTRKISDKGLTCFSVAPNGIFLAFGCSDLTIGLLDALTLNPVVTILKAHELPPTTLSFNTSSQLLVSGSAESVRIVTVPSSTYSNTTSWGVIVFFLLGLLFAIIAVLSLKSL